MGGLTKERVREIATEAGFSDVAKQKEVREGEEEGGRERE